MELFTPYTRPKNKKNELAQELNIDPVLAELLLQRGISTKEEAYRFFILR